MAVYLRWVFKGLLGLLAFLAWETAYVGIPESIAKQIAFVQAVGGESLLRYVELPILGVLLFILAIGPARIKRSAREAVEWYKGHPEDEGDRDLEIQERWREQDALDKYFDQMQQWLDDESRPLLESRPADQRRKLAQARTSQTLKRVGPNGKREVLEFLRKQGLIERDGSFIHPVVRLGDTDLSNAHLVNIVLYGANLDSVNLSGADLTSARLCWFIPYENNPDLPWPVDAARLSNADLIGTVLRGTLLAGCFLVGADFDNAVLDRADLRCADLQQARNLTQEQVNQAYGTYQQNPLPDTKLPTHLEVPEAWKKPLSQQIAEREASSN